MNFVVLRLALRSAGPLTIQTLIALTAGLPMLLANRLIGERLPWARVREVAALGILFTGLASVGTLLGVAKVGASVGALIGACTPLITVLIARLVLGHRAERLTIVGVIVGFCGVAVVVWGGGTTSDPAGVAFMLMAAVCWSSSLILAGKLVQSSSPSALVAFQALLAAPLLLVLGLVREDLTVQWSWGFALALGYAALLGNALSFVLQMKLLERNSAVHASTIAFLTPVTALVVGTIVLGETVVPRQLAGAGIILFGVGLVITRGGKTSKSRSKFSAPRPLSRKVDDDHGPFSAEKRHHSS